MTGLVFSPNEERMIDAHLAELPAENKLLPGDVVTALNGREIAHTHE